MELKGTEGLNNVPFDFYNRKRRHAFLNHMTPVAFEEKHARI